MPRALPSHLLKVEGDAGSQSTIKGGVSALYFSIMLNLKRGEGEVLRGVCCITSKTLKAEENLTYLSLFPPSSSDPLSVHRTPVISILSMNGVYSQGVNPLSFSFFFLFIFLTGKPKNPLTRITQEPSGRY